MKLCRASEFRHLRGPTYIAVIADERAFWLTEKSANPDAEILNAVRPGATTNGPLFLISSPYARRGKLWTLYNKHFGAKGDSLLLVAQAASRLMNPSLSQSVVDRVMERDAASAAAKYRAEFRRDIESFVSIEAVQTCVAKGVYEHAPARSLTYRAFADPSGGSSDSFALAIGHYLYNQQVVVMDSLRETLPPFSPEQGCRPIRRFVEELSPQRRDGGPLRRAMGCRARAEALRPCNHGIPGGRRIEPARAEIAVAISSGQGERIRRARPTC
jgi:hypothetical protein